MAEPKAGGIKELAKGRSDTFRLAPEDIHVEPGWNLREEGPHLSEHIESLAISIAAIGVLEPLTVRMKDGLAFVTNGHCRLRAIEVANKHHGAEILTVPVQLEDRYASEPDRLSSQLTRNSGLRFTPFEQAKVFKRLLDYGWNEQDIAKRAGVTHQRVAQVLDLLTMPEEAKEMVRQGEVSASFAQREVNEADTVEEAVDNLQSAVAEAKKKGKKVATARDLPEAKKQAKAAKKLLGPEKKLDSARRAVENANIKSDQDSVTVTFDLPGFKKLAKALGSAELLEFLPNEDEPEPAVTNGGDDQAGWTEPADHAA